MATQRFTIADTFESAKPESWRKLVEEDLKGASFEQRLVTHTYEGIDLQPVYCRQDALPSSNALGMPGLTPFVRGSSPLGAVETGWDLRQEFCHPDLDVAHREIREDWEGGVTSLLLPLAPTAASGLDPDQRDRSAATGDRTGIAAYHLDDWRLLLDGLPLDRVGVAIGAGAAFLPVAAQLIALWKQLALPAEKIRAAFNADPLGTLADVGALPVSLDESIGQLVELAAWVSMNYPKVTAVGVDTSAYHQAGSTAVQDLAFAIATGVEYLRAMMTGGVPIDKAARQIAFTMSVGTHHFLVIAKLRAARRLWGRIVSVCGGSPTAATMSIHTRCSRRVLTQRDPYVNMLRNTTAVFAAGVAGADAITSVPFDAALGVPGSLGRRVARNTALILQEESHLHRVIDPAGGSWFLDNWTEQLADGAWQIFQQVEKMGGMAKALTSGWVAEQIDAAFAPRAKDIARRKEPITGVSEFPNVTEEKVGPAVLDGKALWSKSRDRVMNQRVELPELTAASVNNASTANQRVDHCIAAAAAGATLGQLAGLLQFRSGQQATTRPLEAHSFAEPFEELRDASDAWLAKSGQRPRVFLANLGPIAHHTARATYAKNFFEAGGFEVITNDGFANPDDAAQALQQSAAKIAVICSSDKLYPDFVPSATAALKGAGARTVVLAGNPGANEDAWRTAGVDRFIFIKCDVLDTLRSLLREEGIVVA
ncbi:MAG: methylmalonyl-CoA mutase family protein [Pirellulaceae bacterium]|nr:methylmalonyl-CoA mutase small subunit [Planctomycetales bacterium]